MDLTSVWLTDIRIPEGLLSETVSVPMFLFSLFFSQGGEQMRDSTHHPLQSERLRSLSCLFLRVQVS